MSVKEGCSHLLIEVVMMAVVSVETYGKTEKIFQINVLYDLNFLCIRRRIIWMEYIYGCTEVRDIKR